MKSIATKILATAFVLLLQCSAWAHHPAVGMAAGDAGPIRTLSADTLKQGSFSFDIQAEIISLKPFSDAAMQQLAIDGNDIHSIDSVRHLNFGLGYGLTDDLTLGIKIPYASLRNIRASNPEDPDHIHSHGNSSGIGDLSVLGRYRVIKQGGNGVDVSLVAGVKMPTGKTSVKDPEGDLLETEHQPGSGSWDPIFGVAVTRRNGPLSLDANIIYAIASKGSQETDLGDLLSYNAAASYRALAGGIALDLVLELNGEWKQKQSIAGIRDENSGEHILLLSPGLRLSLRKNTMAYVSVGFPVMQDINGIQAKTRARTLFGFGIGF
ncbi:MAG: hypothetical protein C0402_07075 [Thermodesulfovibrio sp.]|nr:hypothetical protein [Thermodesulfovibrio sp.]